MARMLPWVGLCVLACGAPQAKHDDRVSKKRGPDLPAGVWQEVDGVPSSPGVLLARTEEPAPGRSDGPNGAISGFCPPRAEVFSLGDGRALVLREPCSGTTFVVLRDASGEHRLENNFYGVGGKWTAARLLGEYLLLVNNHMQTVLLVADLAAAKVTYLPLPRELERVRQLDVHVVDDLVYISGGITQKDVGSGGCENPPPNQGCDPYVIWQDQSNERAWVMRIAK